MKAASCRNTCIKTNKIFGELDPHSDNDAVFETSLELSLEEQLNFTNQKGHFYDNPTNKNYKSDITNEGIG